MRRKNDFLFGTRAFINAASFVAFNKLENHLFKGINIHSITSQYIVRIRTIYYIPFRDKIQ